MFEDWDVNEVISIFIPPLSNLYRGHRLVQNSRATTSSSSTKNRDSNMEGLTPHSSTNPLLSPHDAFVKFPNFPTSHTSEAPFASRATLGALWRNPCAHPPTLPPVPPHWVCHRKKANEDCRGYICSSGWRRKRKKKKRRIKHPDAFWLGLISYTQSQTSKNASRGEIQIVS